MIEFQNVSKWYPLKGRRHYILRDVRCRFPPNRSVGILGRNGAGKSTLVRLIGGTEAPNQGRIVRRVRVSWPLGLGGSFQGRLTGRDNARFVCRIYEEDYGRVVRFVEDFSGLGPFLDVPVATYSSGMRARLGFSLSVALDFDVYLIDEITAVGDAEFRERCEAVLAEKREHASVIMVSHNPNAIRKQCQSAALLSAGQLHWFDDVDEAIAVYEAA